jgi:hypothetical protein
LYSSDYPKADMTTEANVRDAINEILKHHKWSITENEKVIMIAEYYTSL